MQFIDHRLVFSRQTLFTFCILNFIYCLIISLQYLFVMFPLSLPFINQQMYFIVYGFIAISFIGQFTLFIFVILWIPIWILLKLQLKTKIIFLFTGCWACIWLTLLCIDAKLYSLFRFHLNSTFLHFITSGELSDIVGLTTSEWISIYSKLSFILIAEITALFIASRYTLIRYQMAKWLLFAGFFSLLLSYCGVIASIAKQKDELNQQTQAIPLYTNILANLIFTNSALLDKVGQTLFTQPNESLTTITYPKQPLHCKTKKKPNILIILIDSWREDSVTADIMPTVTQYAKQHQWYQNHASGSNCTQYGLFSLFYGLPKQYWSAMLTQHIPPVFLAQAKQQGYDISVYSSSEIHIPNLQETVFLSANTIKAHHDINNALLADAEVSQDFTEHLRHQQKQPWLSILFYNAAHDYCRAPIEKHPFPFIADPCNRLDRNINTDPTGYLNRYKNALFTIDHQINRVFTALNNQDKLENTVIIITGDHGQEFNDNKNNAWDHANNYTRYQVNTPLIIGFPGEGRRLIKTASTHFDLMPTLMDKLFHCDNPYQDYSLGQPLTNHKKRDYFIVSSYTHFGIIENDRINTIYPSGKIAIENKNGQLLPDAVPRSTILKNVLHDLRQFETNH